MNGCEKYMNNMDIPNKIIKSGSKYVLLLGLLFLFAIPVQSADLISVPDSVKKATKSQYIGAPDTLIIVKLNANNEYELFEQKGPGFHYDLRPNISIANKISVNYKFISFSYGFVLPFIPGNDDDKIKGKTKAFAFGLGFSGNHIVQELHYLKIKGFYLNNSGDFDPTWEKDKDPYITLPDNKAVTYIGNTTYKFNPSKC